MPLRIVLPHAGLVAATILIGLSISWIDAIVFAGAAFAVQGTARRLWAVGTVALFTASFPPYSWPTYWICLAPLVWIWREPQPRQSLARQVLESLALGFAMGWLSTGFVRTVIPAQGWLLHAAACLLYSLQFVGIALAIRALQNRPVVVAAALTAVVAVGCEALQAWCGLVWSVTSLSLPLAATPAAQWAAWITPLGVAGILYWVNFLAMPDRRAKGVWGRWFEPITAACIGATAWFGGMLIVSEKDVAPLPFSAMLVQPHLCYEENVTWRPWIELDRLTRASLGQEGPVDLIVWPESCLSVSPLDETASDGGSGAGDFEHRLTVADFEATLRPRYETNCLAGVAMWKQAVETRYGLQVPTIRRYNCGCLISRSGQIACYEKQVLVPFKEGLPAWLGGTEMRGRILRLFGLEPGLSPGDRFQTLSFRDRRGRDKTIAVSICYEAFLFWLPQYRGCQDVDAIVHLVYDGGWRDHREVIERQILACRYRAIETGKWNLVCSTWSGTAVIDPAGRIVRQLPPEAGVLRSNSVDRPVGSGNIQLGCETSSASSPICGLAGRAEGLVSQAAGGGE